MQFLDKVKIDFIGGNGGNGIIAWLRDAVSEFGGPSGGNGGNGGNVILVADHNFSTLYHLRFKLKIAAEHGQDGQIKSMHGRNGEDIIVKVPVGTVISDSEGNVVCDLKEINQNFVVAYGGKGGRGNESFLSNFNKAPFLNERGELGEKNTYSLELKLLADVGLVGKPNAGKSSFITCASRARPKIAPYPFTTLTPVLGTAVLSSNRNFVIADIPGLIEDAHKGTGLGIEFLRHVERCKILVHLVSLDDNDGDEPIEAYETILRELKMYGRDLIQKPRLLVLNKTDALSYEDNEKKFKQKYPNVDYFQTSTFEAKTILPVLEACWKEIDKSRNQVKGDDEIIYTMREHKRLDSKISVTKLNETRYRIEGEQPEYWVNRIPLNTKDNALRLQQKLESLGVITKLQEAGIKNGDSYLIKDVNFDFEG